MVRGVPILSAENHPRRAGDVAGGLRLGTEAQGTRGFGQGTHIGGRVCGRAAVSFTAGRR